ncbi:conserved domain protein [Treponema pallidum subsp. pallidum str. Chicago]|nr:conserved domain protein [Treponema pallidum subsp. pallidum str. Chicago]
MGFYFFSYLFSAFWHAGWVAFSSLEWRGRRLPCVGSITVERVV